MKKQKYAPLLKEPSEFQQWLLDRPTEIVGFIGHKERCPLACWLSARTGQEYVVSRNYYGTEGKSAALPDWAWWFVYLLDVEEGEAAISGKDALDLLESVLESLLEPTKKLEFSNLTPPQGPWINRGRELFNDQNILRT